MRPPRPAAAAASRRSASAAAAAEVREGSFGGAGGSSAVRIASVTSSPQLARSRPYSSPRATARARETSTALRARQPAPQCGTAASTARRGGPRDRLPAPSPTRPRRRRTRRAAPRGPPARDPQLRPRPCPRRPTLVRFPASSNAAAASFDRAVVLLQRRAGRAPSFVKRSRARRRPPCARASSPRPAWPRAAGAPRPRGPMPEAVLRRGADALRRARLTSDESAERRPASAGQPPNESWKSLALSRSESSKSCVSRVTIRLLSSPLYVLRDEVPPPTHRADPSLAYTDTTRSTRGGSSHLHAIDATLRRAPRASPSNHPGAAKSSRFCRDFAASLSFSDHLRSDSCRSAQSVSSSASVYDSTSPTSSGGGVLAHL